MLKKNSETELSAASSAHDGSMLKLVDIKKDYKVGGDVGFVHALKGLSIEFRSNEFVAILGPSGCGKTTLLNIIGGLDHYTSGDLFIDGVSTKDFKDGDWDNYRNHRIGFVFQSYNLIPHQTVLQNVELALTIGGMGREERIAKAKAALDEVGLKGEYDKKPNQLSGGQCQRVAIARAIVSDPEILLADEPTGALDTETSIQIMDIIKEISKDRLVIMVTHNPELAAKYSTRTVRLLDGLIVSDSNPFGKEEKAEKRAKALSNKKAKLSFLSAFRLSAQNLRSKAKRTSLVAVAASIGIIGVSSVLAISSGVQNYIYDMEADMLSGNPLTIQSEGIDLTGLMNIANNLTQVGAVVEGTENGYVNVNETISALVDSETHEVNEFMFKNEITPEYLDYIEALDQELYRAIVFDYGIDVSPAIYVSSGLSGNSLDGVPYSDEGEVASLSLIRTIYQGILGKTDLSEYSSYVDALPRPFSLMPDSDDLILSQYDIVSDEETSHLPKAANEIAIVIGNDSLSDLTLAETGYLTQDEFMNNVYQAIGSDRYDPSLEKNRISYDELMGKTFYWYPNDDMYSNGLVAGSASSWHFDPVKNVNDESEGKPVELRVTAILQKKDGVNYGCLSSGFYYTEAFAEAFRESSKVSQIVEYLKENGLEGFGLQMYSQPPIDYRYAFTFEGTTYAGKDGSGETGYLSGPSQSSLFAGAMGMVGGASSYALAQFSLANLGGSEIPSTISIYPTDLNEMDAIRHYLSAWNEDGDIVVNGVTLTADDRPEIRYTDTLSVVLTMVNSLIEIITTALVIFTGLSLVVSTVMIAVITYVSVIERVKEIGVIRSLGGRKKDVSRLFNAETLIIGFFAGAFGILVTYVLEIICNVIVGSLSGIYTIAALPWYTAVVMIAVSMFLTLVSGLVPASLAAKKDPVEALRSE